MWTRPAAIFSSVVEAPPGGIGNYFGSNAGVVYAFDTGGAYDISGPPSLVATKDLSATTTDVTGPMTFASDGTQLYLANTNLGTTFPNQNIIQFTLSTPWDITTAAYASKAKSYRAEFGTKGIRGMVFKPDGTVVYLSGPSDPNGLDWVQSYTLGTAWDVSTATVSTGKQIFDVNVNLTLIRFKPDGTKMYAVDAGPGGTTSIRTIRQYSLSTAWNISTLTFLSSFQISDTTGTTTEDIINGLDFSPDGTVMFVTASHTGGAKLYQFSLSTPWDVTTATYTGISFESPTSAGSQSYVFFEQTTSTGGGGSDPGDVVDASPVLLAGNDNFSVIKSTDGGATWGPQVTVFSSGFGSVVGLVQLANGNILALSSEGLMSKSTDGGDTWTAYATPPLTQPYAGGVSFSNDSTHPLTYDGSSSVAFVTTTGADGYAHIFASTSNGDEGTWSQRLTDSVNAGNFRGIAFRGGSWASVREGGGAPRAFSAISPATWSGPASISVMTSAVAISSTTNGHFVCVGLDASSASVVSFSADGGATWSVAVAATGLNSGDRFSGVMYVNGVYVALTLNTDVFPRVRRVWRSTDGIAYTNTYTFNSANGDYDMFIRVVAGQFWVGVYHNTDNTSALIHSTDGTTWSSESAFPGTDGVANYIETMIKIDPSLTPVVFFKDTFTGANNTPVDYHTADIG